MHGASNNETTSSTTKSLALSTTHPSDPARVVIVDPQEPDVPPPMELELVRHSGSVGRGQKAATAQPRLLRAGEVNNGLQDPITASMDVDDGGGGDDDDGDGEDSGGGGDAGGGEREGVVEGPEDGGDKEADEASDDAIAAGNEDSGGNGAGADSDSDGDSDDSDGGTGALTRSGRRGSIDSPRQLMLHLSPRGRGGDSEGM
jgi:hypothetical protein